MRRGRAGNAGVWRKGSAPGFEPGGCGFESHHSCNAFRQNISVALQLHRRAGAQTVVKHEADDQVQGTLLGTTPAGSAFALEDEALGRHILVMGVDADLRNELVATLAGRLALLKSKGERDCDVTVIDPEGTLAKTLPARVPDCPVQLLKPSVGDDGNWMNPLTPRAFPDRTDCVDSIVTSIKSRNEVWGRRVEDAVTAALELAYDYNGRTGGDESPAMSVRDALNLLNDAGRGDDTPGLTEVVAGCDDPSTLQAMLRYSQAEPADRHAVQNIVERFIRECRGHADRNSVIDHRRCDWPTAPETWERNVVILDGNAPTTRTAPGAMICGWAAAATNCLMRRQNEIPFSVRRRHHLIAAESDRVPGAPWEHMLARNRMSGGALLLTAATILATASPAGALSNVNTLICGRLDPQTAAIVAPLVSRTERPVVAADLTNLPDRQVIASTITTTEARTFDVVLK